LAQSQVRDICQDNQGYLWIGTNSGLSRFNGIEFVNYSIDDGLPDNNIRKLYISKKGTLWVGTARGLAHFENQEIQSYIFEDQYRINDIAEFKDIMYVASNTGLIQFNDESFVQLEDNDVASYYYVRSMANYKDSILICGTKSGVYSWDGKEFEKFNIPGYDKLNVRNVKIVGDKLYVSARRIGLFSYDLVSKKTNLFDLNYNTVSSINVDETSIFGISTNSGAFLIDKSQEMLYFNETNGLLDNSLECLFKDVEGNVWLGTDGKGLLKFSGTSVVSYSVDDNLGSDLVMSIQQDTTGKFIFGTYDAGITQMTREDQFNYFSVRDILVDNTVWSVMLDSLNRTWLGTSMGLTILDEANQKVEHPLQGISPKIRTMVSIDGETILFGGDHGLLVMQGDSIVELHTHLNINRLYILNNKVYCAGFDGLYEFKKGDYTQYRQVKLPEANVNTLTSDYLGNLWIGTMNGLFVMNQKGYIFEFPLDEREYRAKSILGLISSDDSSIWISGMNGVYQVAKRLDERNGYHIFNYGTPEGLIDEECNSNALYEDYEGNIWIGTARGLAKIDPSFNDVLFDYKKPILHMTGLRLFREIFDYSDYEIRKDSIFGVPEWIELPHNKNHLTFDFIGINHKDPKSVRYEYRLIGANDEWSPISKSSYATYSFLQPGEYNFQVRAINKNNLFSTVKEIYVIITPPFWKTWWFIILITIGGILIVVYIFQARIRSLKQKQENEKLDLKNRLLFLEQRSLNASMNRHFIFNSLNSIQYFINSSDKLSANKYLSSFAKLIRKNLDSSAANNFIVTLQEEIERIELYLSLEQMRFSGKFDYSVKISSSLDTESIEIPSMILQPFVENSIIHGVLSLDRKGEILVEISEELGQVVFTVKDNGLGIDNSLKVKQKSVEGDHESKGVEITNRRIELLRKLTGENLLIIGPFQMNTKEGESLGTKVVLKLGGAEKFGE